MYRLLKKMGMFNKVPQVEDLKGEICEYPIEIVRRMCQLQVEQGNPSLVSIFQVKKDASFKEGGFSWTKSPEGCNFWASIINHSNWGTFFKEYPKTPVITEEVFKATQNDIIANSVAFDEEATDENPFEEETKVSIGDEVIVVDDAGKAFIRIFIAYNEDINATHPVLATTPTTYRKWLSGFLTPNIIAFKSYKVIEKTTMVELTLEDISNGKGVGVPPNLIKIIK